ncbi:MAG: hypothetical protein U1C49_01715 [Candidatus Andersenbacteria bacterium]|nr:hypothetical protein [bacterium]MDZ4225543.1 hypothetical protein [Candidatus Andersenbacteria bacterium]
MRTGVRLAAGAVVAVAVIGLGVVTAFYWSERAEKSSMSVSRPVRINEVILGQFPDGKSGAQAIKETKDFYTTDQIGLRIMAEADSGQKAVMPARLLNSAGQITNLSPNQITLSGGENRFCCWQVEESGEYVLQLFKPGGGITTLPLTVRASTADRAKVF